MADTEEQNINKKITYKSGANKHQENRTLLEKAGNSKNQSGLNIVLKAKTASCEMSDQTKETETATIPEENTKITEKIPLEFRNSSQPSSGRGKTEIDNDYDKKKEGIEITSD